MQYRVKITLPPNLPFECKVPVRVCDLNYGNHVGNERILQYMQEARMQWLATMGYSELSFGSFGLIMADVAVNYRKEIKYPALLQVKIGVLEMSKMSFTLGYQISRVATDNGSLQIIAECTTNMVIYNYDIGRPATLEQSPKERLMLYYCAND